MSKNWCTLAAQLLKINYSMVCLKPLLNWSRRQLKCGCWLETSRRQQLKSAKAANWSRKTWLSKFYLRKVKMNSAINFLIWSRNTTLTWLSKLLTSDSCAVKTLVCSDFALWLTGPPSLTSWSTPTQATPFSKSDFWLLVLSAAVWVPNKRLTLSASANHRGLGSRYPSVMEPTTSPWSWKPTSAWACAGKKAPKPSAAPTTPYLSSSTCTGCCWCTVGGAIGEWAGWFAITSTRTLCWCSLNWPLPWWTVTRARSSSPSGCLQCTMQCGRRGSACSRLQWSR